MKLGFGLGHAVPEDVLTAWGARLIEPNDLLHDRQDLQSDNDEAKATLSAWLNGDSGNGAIAGALTALRGLRLPQSRDVTTVYEDDRGVIVASTNQSHGYVYVAGWLK